MKRWIRIFYFLYLSFSTSLFAADKAIILDMNGNVGPATEHYIKQGLATAIEQGAKVVILRINTTQGLESTMRHINQTIMASPLPFIAYVAPENAAALGIGTYILYASHLAVMAPETEIGNASPFHFGGTHSPLPQTMSDKQKKAVTEATHYLQNLATLRERNPRLAETTVQQAAVLTAQGAQQEKVINGIAENIPQLLEKMDGQKVLILGSAQEVKTKNLVPEVIAPDWHYQLLAILTDPNVAYLLILLAIYGLFFEIASPGFVVPGVVGTVSLLLAIYAFQFMPINYTALTLLFIGITFITFEVYVSSLGVIGIAGIIAFILGSMELIDSTVPSYQIATLLIIIMAIVTLAFFFVALSLTIRSLRKSVVTGREGLISSEGVVISCIQHQLLVTILGETWQAQSTSLIEPGEKIRVIEVKGLLLIVEPLKK
jgi:membrane-bound serine protease (ClpP class)